MKNIRIVLVALMGVMFLTSCYQHEMEKVQAENDSLRLEIGQDQENLAVFAGAFSSIQENLDSIKRLEKLISVRSLHSAESQRNAEDDINDDIRTIYSLLKQNRDKLNAMRRNVLSKGQKVKELEEMLGWMEKQIQWKNGEIDSLRYELATRNVKIDGLEDFIEQLESNNDTLHLIAQNQDEELNKVWYVIGTKKELLENNIITKEGGFLGIGSIKKLKPDFNEEYFTQIDLRKDNRISIYHNKVKVLTDHPEDSYRLSGEENVEELQIIDPERFWKSTRYLVIMLK